MAKNDKLRALAERIEHDKRIPQGTGRNGNRPMQGRHRARRPPGRDRRTRRLGADHTSRTSRRAVRATARRSGRPSHSRSDARHRQDLGRPAGMAQRLRDRERLREGRNEGRTGRPHRTEQQRRHNSIRHREREQGPQPAAGNPPRQGSGRAGIRNRRSHGQIDTATAGARAAARGDNGQRAVIDRSGRTRGKTLRRSGVSNCQRTT